MIWLTDHLKRNIFNNSIDVVLCFLAEYILDEHVKVIIIQVELGDMPIHKWRSGGLSLEKS